MKLKQFLKGWGKMFINNWYNSQFFVNISLGAAIFLILTGIGGCFNLMVHPLPSPNITSINQGCNDAMPNF